MRLGVFGGTFNPPHIQHLNLARTAFSELKLDKLLIFPCGEPPHKFCAVDKNTREELARAAFCGIGEIDDFELRSEGKSYTVNTLRMLKNKYPDAEIYLLIGGDSLRDFHTWHEPESIASLCTLAVAGRDGLETEYLLSSVKARFNCAAVLLGVSEISVSSSEIRLRYQFGFDCGSLVPPQVDSYILAERLYSNYRQMCLKLRAYLPEKRLMHTFYVVKAGLEISSSVPQEKVFLACALHDCAKYVPEENYSYYGFDSAGMPKSVRHAFLGALVAEKDFGINDAAILDAIRYHTTGRPDMTELDMIVYIADKTEQTRPYGTAHLFKENLEKTFVEVLKEAAQFCGEEHAGSVHPLTKETVDFYINKKKV